MASHGLRRQFLFYVALDIISIGAGMGVPIFSIILGLLVGWRIVAVLDLAARPLGDALGKVLLWAGLTSGATCAFMVVLWGTTLPKLFDRSADLAHFGIPLILFEPRASFIGWLALMIVVSPALQFLMTVFGAHLALLRHARRAAQAMQ